MEAPGPRSPAPRIQARLGISPEEIVTILHTASSQPDPRLPDVLSAFRTQWEYIGRWKYRQLGDDLEDALQIALVKLVSPDSLRGLRDPAGVERWGWTLFAHTAIDLLRELGREHRRVISDDADGPPLSERMADAAPTPEEQIVARDRVQAVLAEVQRLDVARLRWIADLPEKDIAARLGMTRDAVAGQLKRVRRQLRDILGGDER